MNMNYIKEIAEALSDNHAVLMVGAGFSKNAEKVAVTDKKFLNWNELSDLFYETIYDENGGPGKEYNSSLRLAQEVEVTVGRPKLEKLIREAVPDLDYAPSELYMKMMGMPWKDVFTTNYDTLLERAADKVTKRRYNVVISQNDLVNSNDAPRILKLHGSFPSYRPFIITEEDYRTYPIKFAAMVNTVQQALLENVFCMIGFSCEDPNFINWIGWIHDNLGKSSSQKMYMISVSHIAEAKRKLLFERNIIVVDLQELWPTKSVSARLSAFFEELKLRVEEKNRKDNWFDYGKIDLHHTTDFSQKTEIMNKLNESYPGWIFLPWKMKNKVKFILKSTHNRRERPIHGHRGGSRGRFYYRITTFEERPWDARDPHKTTFMTLKHAIRLSIWQRQKETPGVEKAPGVSSPQRKESGRSGRDDGELRFWVRPGHPYKAVTSISQAEALAHGLAHLHLLCGATVRAVELDGIAALQDAVEDAFPSLIAGRVVDSPWVEVRGDDHGLARFVAPVDDGVDLLHHVARVSLRTQVLDEKQVVGEHAVEFALAFVERLLHEVHDVADIRLKRGEAEVDDAVGYRRGHVRFAGADIAEQEKAVGVLRVEGSRIALAQRRRVGGLAVISLEGAVAVEAARRKALLAHLLRLHSALLGLLALFALALLGLRAFTWDGHDA